MIHGFREGSGMLPRIAKIRLGVKRQGQSGGEYPSDTDYFVLTDCPEVAKVYGATPKSLVVMFASDLTEVNFPTRLESWKASPPRDGQPQKSSLFCHSDGRTAFRVYAEKDLHGKKIVDALPVDERPDPGETFELPCPYESCPYYEQKACKRVGRLNVVLPEVSLAGIYQVETSSAYGFGNILDMIDDAVGPDGTPAGWAMKMTASAEFPRGHIAWRVPFELYREPQTLTPPEMKGKGVIKHILRLRIIDDDARLAAMKVKVPRWMAPGWTPLMLGQAPEADHPVDLLPGDVQKALPALPAPIGEAPAPAADWQSLARELRLSKAKVEWIEKQCGGDIEKMMVMMREVAAKKKEPAKAAPAAAPTSAPAPATAPPQDGPRTSTGEGLGQSHAAHSGGTGAVAGSTPAVAPPAADPRTPEQKARDLFGDF